MMADSVTQTLNVTVSAPGKIILFGEHSVVYGKTAVAAALKHRTTVEITECGSNENLIELNFLSIKLHKLYKIASIFKDIHSGHNFLLESKLEFNLDTPEKLNHSNVLEFVNNFINEIDRDHKYSNAQLKACRSFFVLLIGMLLSVNIKIHHMIVKVTSQLPIGAGCGSSASFGVSLAGALLSFIKCKSKLNENISVPGFQEFKFPNNNQDELVSRWAFLAEIIQHGRPSGIDNMVCTKGSIIQFCKGADGKTFTVNKLTQLLNLKILLVDTGVQRNTGDLAASVLNKKIRHPQLVETILHAMDILAKEAAKLISEMSETEDNDKVSNLEELIDVNQSLLCALGVSHPSLDKIVEVASASDLHAKLTGAGGGGCAFLLLPHTIINSKLNVLKEQLSILGFSHTEAVLGGPGIIYHD